MFIEGFETYGAIVGQRLREQGGRPAMTDKKWHAPMNKNFFSWQLRTLVVIACCLVTCWSKS